MKKHYISKPRLYSYTGRLESCIANLDKIESGVEYNDNCTSYIHPFNAQLLAFFNGTDTIDEIYEKASEYFGLPQDKIEELLKRYIENEQPFSNEMHH